MKSKLEFISRVLIESFDVVLEQSIQSVPIERKQFFYNIKEKIAFFKMKFESFIIEMENVMTNNGSFEMFNGSIKRLTAVLIEFYVGFF